MTGQAVLAVVVALISACCYATAAALQRRETARAALDPHEPGSGGGVAFFRALIRRRWWWAGVVTMALGALIHVVALALGPVTLVQPIGVTTLIIALPLDAWLEERRILRLEWVGATVLVAGLAGLFLLAPNRPRLTVPDGLHALQASGVVVVLVIVIVAASARAPLVPRAVARAAASGMCAGGVSGLVRVLIRMIETGRSPVLIAAVGVVALVLPVASVLLLQTAYRDGGLDAGMSTQITVDQVTAAAIGLTVLSERFTAGALGASLAAVSAVVAVVGLVTLVRVSPRATPPRPARVPAGPPPQSATTNPVSTASTTTDQPSAGTAHPGATGSGNGVSRRRAVRRRP